MVIPPGGGGEQDIQARNRRSPGQLGRLLKPLRVLDGLEALIMSKASQLAKSPCLPLSVYPSSQPWQFMVAQHLHHRA